MKRKKSFNPSRFSRLCAADKPFDFVFAEGETALVCESDPLFREKNQCSLNRGY